MTQVAIRIGQSDTYQHIYAMSNEKIKYLLKFVDSITDEPEGETDLMKEIEIGFNLLLSMITLTTLLETSTSGIILFIL